MARDIIDILDEFIPGDNPREWSKLSSTINSRRLELHLLKEILIELRKLNKSVCGGFPNNKAAE